MSGTTGTRIADARSPSVSGSSRRSSNSRVTRARSSTTGKPVRQRFRARSCQRKRPAERAGRVRIPTPVRPGSRHGRRRAGGTGETHLYRTDDGEDPSRQTWSEIFPDLGARRAIPPSLLERVLSDRRPGRADGPARLRYTSTPPRLSLAARNFGAVVHSVPVRRPSPNPTRNEPAHGRHHAGNSFKGTRR